MSQLRLELLQSLRIPLLPHRLMPLLTLTIFLSVLKKKMFELSASCASALSVLFSPLHSHSMKISLNRAIHDDNPKFFRKGMLPDYSPKTSTTTLREHLMKKHHDAYIQACTEFGWEMRRDSHDGDPLSPTSSRDNAGREPFTSQSLVKFIANFIVADDQVSIHLINSILLLTLLTCRLLMLWSVLNFVHSFSFSERT
jgi:hypothetical protein